jgi:hypothetical protein
MVISRLQNLKSMGPPPTLSELVANYRPWHPALHDFIREAGRILPADVWNFMRYLSVFDFRLS